MDDMPPDTFVDLLNKAIEQEAEDKLWQKWLVELPYMSDKFIPFDEYKRKHFEEEETKKTDEEILQDADNILKMMSR